MRRHLSAIVKFQREKKDGLQHLHAPLTLSLTGGILWRRPVRLPRALRVELDLMFCGRAPFPPGRNSKL